MSTSLMNDIDSIFCREIGKVPAGGKCPFTRIVEVIKVRFFKPMFLDNNTFTDRAFVTWRFVETDVRRPLCDFTSQDKAIKFAKQYIEEEIKVNQEENYEK